MEKSIEQEAAFVAVLDLLEVNIGKHVIRLASWVGTYNQLTIPLANLELLS